MAEHCTPQVELCGYGEFRLPDSVPFEVDRNLSGWDSQNLIEFAGRACYQSWPKPNAATATNAGYITHILQVGHLSVLEHSFAAFYITGVSRSFTHELVRHRHLSFSQLSQRYVNESQASMVCPEIIQRNGNLLGAFNAAVEGAQDAYDYLVEGLMARLAHIQDRTLRRKLARQAARAVMPNATETRIVVSGNYRAWRHFINMRATEHADVEIRFVAMAVLSELQTLAPNIFGDYRRTRLDDGSEVAFSSFVETP